MSATDMAWLESAMERLQPSQAKYREDPVGWVHDVVGAETWSGQREILEALVTERRIAVKAGHSLGKSFIVGNAAMWWLQAYGPERSFVITTAPSFNQVRTILWKEIGRAHEKSGAPYHLNQTEVWAGGEIVAMGRKPADYNEDAFQGIHAEHVLVIIDEACGVPQILWEAADSIASNDGSCILAIGNPTNPSSYFRNVCESRVWKTIRLDGYNSPNFTGEIVAPSLHRVLMSRNWVEEKKEEWGEDSPLFISRVRGEFPVDSDDGVIPYSWLSRCMYEPSEKDLKEYSDSPIEMGIDVGAGGDKTIAYARQGPHVLSRHENNSSDPEEIVKKLMKFQFETEAELIKIDVIGVGFGIYGSLKEKLRDKGVRVRGVNVARKPRDPARFLNLRSELWWEVGRELSRNGGWNLHGVPDDAVDQLAKPEYTLNALHKVVVESKEDLRARIGRSPDDADALLLAFYDPPKKRRAVRAKSNK